MALGAIDFPPASISRSGATLSVKMSATHLNRQRSDMHVLTPLIYLAPFPHIWDLYRRPEIIEEILG